MFYIIKSSKSVETLIPILIVHLTRLPAHWLILLDLYLDTYTLQTELYSSAFLFRVCMVSRRDFRIDRKPTREILFVCDMDKRTHIEVRTFVEIYMAKRLFIYIKRIERERIETRRERERENARERRGREMN